MTYTIQFILVFICVGVSDVAWTMYIIKSNERRALASASWATVILLLSSYTVLSYTEDNTMIIPAIVGGFVGTYFTIKYSKGK